MSKSHRTQRYYTTLTVGILPLLIYFLQLIGKFSSIAAAAAGVLIVGKVMIEWLHHYVATPRQVPSSPSRARLVRVQPPLAGCYLCRELRPLRPHVVSNHRVGICQHCYDCVSFSAAHF